MYWCPELDKTQGPEGEIVVGRKGGRVSVSKGVGEVEDFDGPASDAEDKTSTVISVAS